MRKLNAICALVAILVLLDHSISCSIKYATGATAPSPLPLIIIFIVAVAVHAISSIVLLVRAKSNKRRTAKASGIGKPRSYGRLNAATTIRRISGPLILVFALLHAGMMLSTAQNAALHLKAMHMAQPFISLTVLTVLLYLHLFVSVDGLLMGLGIAAPRWVAVALKVVVAVIGIALLCLLISTFLAGGAVSAATLASAGGSL